MTVTTPEPRDDDVRSSRGRLWIISERGGRHGSSDLGQSGTATGTASTSLHPAPPRPPQRAVVVGQKNRLFVWLEEEVARHEMTPAQGDQMMEESGSAIRNRVSPAEDALGSAKPVKTMATDFASWKGAKVVFGRSPAGHQLVTFKGWPANRSIVRGTRYRVDHPKMIELQMRHRQRIPGTDRIGQRCDRVMGRTETVIPA